MAYNYDGISYEHLRQRFFPTSGARSSCYRRVGLLIEADYLQSTRLASSTGKGSGKAFLTPAAKARPLLATELGLSRAELRRIRMSAPGPIYHHLAGADIHLALELATLRSSLFTLTDWTSDAELHRSPIRVKNHQNQRIDSLIPDSAFTLALSDHTEQLFYLEIDMGTVGPKKLRPKLRGYLSRKNAPCPVLFVTNTPARQAALECWALEEARQLKADPTLFWLTTKERVTELTVLDAPIWKIVGGPAALALTAVVTGHPSPDSEPTSVSASPAAAMRSHEVHQL